jgi:hypothetical protein
MAADYKKLFINWIDKIVFVAFLALLLFQVFKFLTSRPNEDVFVPAIPNKPLREEPALYKERFVLRNLRNPVEPDARHDLTTDPEKIEPGPGEKQCPRCGWIVAQSAAACPRCQYNWHHIETPPPDGPNGPPPVVVEGIPFKVLAIDYRPVDILFYGYIRLPDGTFIQINFANNTRTNLVPEGGVFQDYNIGKLEKKDVMVKRQGFPKPVPEPRYSITIQKEGGEPIRVEKGQSVTESLPVATFERLSGPWQVKHGKKLLSQGQTTFDVYTGDTLVEMGGEGKTFEILSVAGNRVTVKDEQGKETEIPLSG